MRYLPLITLLLVQFGLCHAQLSLSYNRIRSGDKLLKYPEFKPASFLTE